uniref:Insulin-like peptide 1 n=1 Tax=Cydia pomonella TaxID=82600 RepID=A0A514YLL7_CYDPO|nr:insulin-like peptide 1 [Cydia pomonella]
MKLQIVIFMVIISVISAQNPQVYCGRRLARTLAVLCFEDFNREDKRSNYIDTYGHEGRYSSPWLPASAALSLMRGKRQGIATECCDKPCTIDEMMTYC